MTTTLLQTPLHDWHRARDARMVDFGGWSMPVQYTSIVEEHTACRQRAALFDVSHMGRFRFDGPGAESLLDSLCTRRIAGMAPGKIRYSVICNESGGILDDVLVYRLTDDDGGTYFWMVVNASNREKIADWIHQHLADAGEVQFEDRTRGTAMLALQGPRALEIAGGLTDVPLAELRNYSGTHGPVCDRPAMVSRTGYTGEDGIEVTVAADDTVTVWEALLQAGDAHGISPAGLGARDTLRLEAAMPLYGHELTEEIGPIQAGLGFAVNLKDRDFSGRTAIERQMQDPTLPRRVGLEMSGRRVPREHQGVFHGDKRVGEVTSGTFSPTLEKPIAMAYVHPHLASEGTTLSIDIRGRREPALVVPLPFYKRP